MTEKEIVSALRVTESRSKRELLDAAADLIEKLTDRCARYAEEIAVAQERTRWIPVTERLPEDSMQKVLVFVPYIHGDIVDVGRYLGAGGWVLEGWYLTQSAVTHWMPLPEWPAATPLRASARWESP